MKRFFALVLFVIASVCEAQTLDLRKDQELRPAANYYTSRPNQQDSLLQLNPFFGTKNALTVTYHITSSDPIAICKALSGGKIQRPSIQSPSKSLNPYQVLIPVNGTNEVTVTGDVEVQKRALAIVAAMETSDQN